jgi:hypothetical protein
MAERKLFQPLGRPSEMGDAANSAVTSDVTPEAVRIFATASASSV